jgi:hypothetical protein
VLLARLERVPARLARRALLRGVCEAAVCIGALWSGWAARILSRGLSWRRLVVNAVLVVLVVVAPVVAVVCILLRSHPLLRLCTVHVGLEGHRLPSREGRGRAVTAACQLRSARMVRARYSGDLAVSPAKRYGPDMVSYVYAVLLPAYGTACARVSGLGPLWPLSSRAHARFGGRPRMNGLAASPWPFSRSQADVGVEWTGNSEARGELW